MKDNQYIEEWRKQFQPKAGGRVLCLRCGEHFASHDELEASFHELKRCSLSL